MKSFIELDIDPGADIRICFFSILQDPLKFEKSMEHSTGDDRVLRGNPLFIFPPYSSPLCYHVMKDNYRLPHSLMESGVAIAKP